MQPIIATAPALAALSTHLARQARIGLDTEFLRERTYRAQLCLVQVAAGDEAQCVDPLALGDLGRHFPDTDPRYRGISSLRLLRNVVDLVTARGGRLVNVDASVLAQAPRLAPLLPELA